MARHEGSGITVGQRFEATPLLGYLEFEVAEVTENSVVIEMPVGEHQINLYWMAHGGAIATMIDVTAAVTMSHLTELGGPTVHLDVHYLAPGSGDRIRAEGRILKAGRRLVNVEVDVTGEHGVHVARAIVTLAPQRI